MITMTLCRTRCSAGYPPRFTLALRRAPCAHSVRFGRRGANPRCRRSGRAFGVIEYPKLAASATPGCDYAAWLHPRRAVVRGRRRDATRAGGERRALLGQRGRRGGGIAHDVVRGSAAERLHPRGEGAAPRPRVLPAVRLTLVRAGTRTRSRGGSGCRARRFQVAPASTVVRR